MSAEATIELTVNGRKRSVTTDPQRPLLEVLREEWELAGAKYGCGEAQCGACSVLVDGRRAFSCRTVVSSVAGKAVRTIEGLANGDKLHAVQQAFLDEGALQCGYCVPGMIMTAVALLEEKPHPSDDEIVEAMNRNMCRCCNYPNILNAVRRAANSGGK
ncbi:MAG TPA: (2Fe-2S)-binding protein [Verrucomicrobiales bacterium]|jgi:aerobic-type carbon monoxide dehydrogenase small subunit (CoxS/CutS family)|nr:(2Fe-2S)-binding protein [Verrucomicrobiales bacterium]